MRIFVPAVAAALALSACAAGTTHHTSPAVQISVSACGVGWTARTAGPQKLTLHNTDSRAGEAQLIDVRTKAVYADVEPFGPGTTAAVEVSLPAGNYAWRCLMSDEPAVVGNAITLTGKTARTTPGVVPVTQADLIAPTKQYEQYVAGQLPPLAAAVNTLRDDLTHHDRARAEHDWLAAHLRYERLGAAYDAFGDLDGAINGLPAALPKGVHDPGWTGFHRIEYGLWHGESDAVLVTQTAALLRAVDELRSQFATTQLDPLQIAIRAHEISENALQFELTGSTDFGSHSELATVRANLEGTETVLSLVRPLLAPRYPELDETLRQLHDSEADIDANATHDRIDADISELCELLAPVAVILEPRNTR